MRPRAAGRRRGRATSLVAAALLLLVAGPAHGKDRDGARKRGRVQRVERTTERTRNICQLRAKQRTGQPELLHTCWGRKPMVGAIAIAVDDVGYRATVRVTEVVPELDICDREIRWYIQFETLEGTTADADDSGTFLVFGFDVSRQARTRSDVGVPDNRPYEQLWTGFSSATTAGEPAELIVTFYTCDRPGSRLPSDQIWDYCIEYYVAVHGVYESIGTDYVPACSAE